jgi:tripartite-type tricarboxylate transporter receptor subunit TctC
VFSLHFVSFPAALAAVLLAGLPVSGGAAEFPEKPVRLIVGFGVGGGSDQIARLIARDLPAIWGQSVPVENRPGADGMIAAAAIANGPADGYNLAVITNGHTISPAQRSVPYDPVESFAPVILVASTPNFLVVHPSLPVHSVKQLIALAKARPGEISFGSSGGGTSAYFASEMFRQMAGLDVVHVPYKGSAQAAIGILSGEVQMMFGALATIHAHIKAGRLRVLAISAPQRWEQEPGVPTVAESGLKGFQAASWYGVLAHAKTPPEIVRKINADMVKVVKAPALSQALKAQGFDVIANSPEQFREVIKADLVRWAAVVKNSRN